MEETKQDLNLDLTSDGTLKLYQFITAFLMLRFYIKLDIKLSKTASWSNDP